MVDTLKRNTTKTQLSPPVCRSCCNHGGGRHYSRHQHRCLAMFSLVLLLSMSGSFLCSRYLLIVGDTIRNNNSNNNMTAKVEAETIATTKTVVTVQSVPLAAANDHDDDADTAASSTQSSLLASEVESIQNFPFEKRIIVRFFNKRSCRNPRIFGRLSGQYLALVEWEYEYTYTADSNSTLITATNKNKTTASENHSTTGGGGGDLVVDRIVGHYSVPSGGRYFLEVIGLFCNWINDDAGGNSDGNSDNSDDDGNFKDVCMEDPTKHRITHETTAFIDVLGNDGGDSSTTTTNGSSSSSSAAAAAAAASKENKSTKEEKGEITAAAAPYGYWEFNSNSSNIQQPPLLLTRYQPQNCRKENELQQDRCSSAMSLDRFDPYRFVYSNNNDGDEAEADTDDDEQASSSSSSMSRAVRSKLIEQLQQNHHQSSLRFCFIGLSHAREMSREVNAWLQSDELGLKLNQNISSSTVTAINIDAQFPRSVNPKQILKKKCTSAVIAAGQWSAGRKPPGGRYRGLPPTNFRDYETEVRSMIERLQLQATTNFHLRSIHYNALGDVKTTCPPQDWRSPTVIDGYNKILVNLTSQMNVSFIDTNFIVGPLWDISKDFCHYRFDKVAKAEALYVLWKMLE